jgi:pentatricopeptide repeat protein
MTEMRRRMSRPPFTAQIDHAERLDALERAVEDLARFISPEGLAASDALYRAAERLRPDDPWIRYNHGVLLSDLSLSEQAAHAFRAFLRSIPHDVPAREKLSVALASGGRFEEALRVCEELNREQPDFDPPYYTRAYTLARLGRYEDSLAVYREMLDRDPEEAPRIWREIGNLLTRLGRETEAREAFRRGEEATGRE